MQKGIPVEMVWMGDVVSRSPERQVQYAGHLSVIMQRAEDWILLTHGAEDAMRALLGGVETHRNWPGTEFQRDRGRALSGEGDSSGATMRFRALDARQRATPPAW